MKVLGRLTGVVPRCADNDSSMPRPLRILYVARAPFVSGAERALVSMLRHAPQDAVEPCVVLGCESPLVDLVRGLGLSVHIVPLAKRTWREGLGYLRSRRQLGRLIDSFQPDRLHANDMPSSQALSDLGHKRKIKNIIHVRWQITASEASWWLPGGATDVICISRWMREQLGDTAGTSLAPSHVTVLPDLVDWPAIEEAPPPHPRNPATDSHGPVTLGFAGQLIPDKGLDLVIEAIAQQRPEHRPRLLVAGADTQRGGTYAQSLQAMAAERGVTDCITWLGFLPEISQLYEQVDWVVCPSRVEPLGLVPLEAARFGVPAIANRVGGLAESIEPGRTGLLVEPTVTGWTFILPRLTEPGLRDTLGQAAREHVKAHHAPAVYWKHLLEIYRR